MSSFPNFSEFTKAREFQVSHESWRRGIGVYTITCDPAYTRVCETPDERLGRIFLTRDECRQVAQGMLREICEQIWPPLFQAVLDAQGPRKEEA